MKDKLEYILNKNKRSKNDKISIINEFIRFILNISDNEIKGHYENKKIILYFYNFEGFVNNKDEIKENLKIIIYLYKNIENDFLFLDLSHISIPKERKFYNIKNQDRFNLLDYKEELNELNKFFNAVKNLFNNNNNLLDIYNKFILKEKLNDNLKEKGTSKKINKI